MSGEQLDYIPSWIILYSNPLVQIAVGCYYILDVSGGCKGRLWRKAIRIEATAPDVRFCAPAYGIAHNSKNCWVYDTYYVIHASLDIKLVKGTYLHQQTSPEMARNGHHIGTLYTP